MQVFRFFASYAHRDSNADPLQREFFNDLSATIQRIDAAEAGFFDVEGIPIGGDWPRTLDGALNSARCMLSFYSPDYFNSKACGQEVKALQLRVDAYKSQNAGSDPDLLVPVLWENELNIKPRIPRALSSKQYGLPLLPNKNRHELVRRMLNDYGLRFIMAKKKAGDPEYASAYLDIVEAFAQEIKRVTNAYDISGVRFPSTLEQLANDFPVERRPDAPLNPPSSDHKGPRFVRALFLVGKPGHLATLAERSTTTAYDEDPRLWKPFLPPTDDTVGQIVAAAAIAEKLIVDWVGASQCLDANAIREIVQRAQNDNNVLIVIVDPWSALLPDLNALLKILDANRIKYGSIFIPWNDVDNDVTICKSKLQQAIEDAFELTAADNAAMLSESFLRSPRNMEDQLRNRIAVIRCKIVSRLGKEGRVRPLPAGSPIPRASVPV